MSHRVEASSPTAAGAGRAPGSVRVRLATFNIRRARGFDGIQSWPFRRRLTADTIDHLDVDMIGLQEAFEGQRRYLARRLSDSRWYGEGRSGGRRGEQCPVAVIAPTIVVVDHRTMWFGDASSTPGTRLPDASFPRIATVVKCRAGDDPRQFVVANTHLDERIHDNRVVSVRQLVEALDLDVPSVVLGDFNATQDDAEVFAPLVEAGFERAPLAGATHHEFTGSVEGTQIDHIFVSRHWTIEDSDVVRTRRGRLLPSDHWPVRAVVSL